MQLKEVFERSGIEADDKARRVLNVSSKVASITADEIEDGVSIERLETIGVPVFKYSGQVTIHGKLPEFTVFGFFMERDDAVKAFKEFPRDLFAGSVSAGSCPFGGYGVQAHIGAVYEKDVWPLIHALWGIENQAAYDLLVAARAVEYEKQQAQWAAERKVEDAQREEKQKEYLVLCKAYAAVMGEPLRVIPETGRFRRVWYDEGGFGSEPCVKVKEYVLQRRGGKVCFRVDGKDRWREVLPTGKLREKWTRIAAEGLIFPSKVAAAPSQSSPGSGTVSVPTVQELRDNGWKFTRWQGGHWYTNDCPVARQFADGLAERLGGQRLALAA